MGNCLGPHRLYAPNIQHRRTQQVAKRKVKNTMNPVEIDIAQETILSDLLSKKSGTFSTLPNTVNSET